MKVFFLRHGQAGDPEEWKGDDAARPLTDDGKTRMAREAKTLAKLGIKVDSLLSSPLVRAKQTADIVGDALGVRGAVEDERLAPGFGLDKLAAIVADHSREDAIMLVGHEPGFSETIGALVGGARIDLKKGGLAYVEVTAGSAISGELVWLLPPKLLVL